MLQTLKFFILFVVVALLANCSSVFDTLNTNTTSGNKAVIAVLLPISGSNADLSRSLLRTIEIANKNNLNKNILIKVYDTKGDPLEAKKQMKEALADHAQIVIGPLFAKSTQALAKLADNSNIPIFTLSNDIRLLKDYNNVIMLANSPFYDIEAEVYYAKHKGSSKVAILAPKNAYGDLSVAFLKESLLNNHLELVKIVRYNPNEARLTYEIGKLIPYSEKVKYEKTLKALKTNIEVKDANGNILQEPAKPTLDFDTLIIADEGKRLAVVAAHFPLIDLDIEKLTIIGNSQWESNLVLQNDVLQHAYYVADVNNLQDTSFYKEYLAYYNEPPNKLSATMYDAFLLASSLVYKDAEGNIVLNFTKDPLGNTKIIDGVQSPFYVNQNNIKAKEVAIKQILHYRSNPVTTLQPKEFLTINSYLNVLTTVPE